MRAVILGAVVASACVAGSLHQLRAADPQTVMLAVVRADGILIPFGTRTGGRWTNAWPIPEKRVGVPVRLDDLPRRWWGKAGPSLTWQAWSPAGGVTSVTVDRPAWYGSYCQQGVGLQSSLTRPAPLPPATVNPYPKLGLAATGDVVFRRIESLDGRHPLGAALLDVLSKPFADAEVREYLALAAGDAYDRPARSPAQLPGALRLDALHRMPLSDGRLLYYFEIVRRYPEMPEASSPRSGTVAGKAPPDCLGLSFASGWFIGTATKVPDDIHVEVQLLACDYGGASLMLPLGYIADAEGALWIGQLSGWGGEKYVVLRSNGRRAIPDVLLATRGGRCG